MTAEREYIEAMLRMVRQRRDFVGCHHWETELLRIDNPKAWPKKRMDRAERWLESVMTTTHCDRLQY